MIKGAVLVYTLNETDLWRQRRDELIKEAERERLIRGLRAGNTKGGSRGRRSLLDRLRAAFQRMPEKEITVAECKE